MENDHTVWYYVTKIVAIWVAYLGTISLVQIQAIVGIGGGLAVIGYTCLQAYILWRDKIVRYRPPGSATRSSDTRPTPL